MNRKLNSTGLHKMRWKSVLLCTVVSFSAIHLHAENRESNSYVVGIQQTISGKVTDMDGKPLAGVTVAEKGSKNSTQTNKDGKYAISVGGSTRILTFSYIGFESKEVTAIDGVTVQLTQVDGALDEVVVVGYGRQKKTNLTTAVSQVSKETLENRPSPTVANMLQGAAPGLVISRNSGRPGAQGLNLQVRGATSANGDADPLYVIDGVVSTAATFLAINPNDIENISILKDGGATAIYGAQSAGGVLLVTTKGGVAGKTRIAFSNNTAFQRAANIPNRLSLIDEMNYMNLARANAGLGPEYFEVDLDRAVNGPTFVEGADKQWLTYNQENILDYVIRDSYGMYNNNLQMSGGTEGVNYMTSIGNMTQDGVFKVGEDRFSRWNARANLSAKLNKYLKLDLRSSYINEANDNPTTGGYGIDGGGNGILRQFFSSRGRFPLLNEDGTYYRSGTSSALGYALLRDGGFDRNRKSNFSNNVTATIANFIDGLQVRLMYSREDIGEQKRDFRRTVTYYSGPNKTFPSYQNNPNNYSITNYKTLQENYQAIVDYNFKVADNHNFQVMGGYQFLDFRYEYVSASTRNLYVNDNPSLNFTSDPANKSHNQVDASEAMQSYFGRLNYDYKGKYLFEATVRNDESSRLSKSTRRKTFPSFSAGWNILREDWFSVSSDILSELKPRVSWGKVGSQVGIGYFDYLSLLYPQRSSTTTVNLILNDVQQAYLYQRSIPATELSWETVETRNIGLDFSMLNRRLSGSFDYYNKLNNDMLVSVSLPATIGIDVPKSNDGRLKTWGWELSLNYKDKIGSDFTYSVTANVADNQNKLIYFGGASDVVKAGVNGKREGFVEGYALNSIWGYKTDGYFQTAADLAAAPSYERIVNVTNVPGLGDVRYVDVNGDGMIGPGKGTLEDTGDMVYLGDINPRYQYGLNINLGYKNFDFSMFVQGIGKRKFKPSNELIQPALYSWYLPMSFHTDYWTEDNRDAAFPRPYLSGNHNFVASDKWFLNGAYARLKNVQLGYTLRKESFAKLPFSRVRFYLSGEDLFTVSAMGIFKGVVDPEMKPEDDKISPYPFAKTYSFGLNIDF
ncbi:SusC/RagA family TonB-linked outer membrane protein [Sphingobacterium tabacisoli]|uniref:SusC/RagA family TonB-linked outer membrane protein n=1 Tax=Sphingobacterium tabacisoli TaxID=2044855 RepID=A0ABW5KXF0_9SPHI|nr:TonB-dependent receptor [Sphingobacterium tabacisoli]